MSANPTATVESTVIFSNTIIANDNLSTPTNATALAITDTPSRATIEPANVDTGTNLYVVGEGLTPDLFIVKGDGFNQSEIGE